ncbi:L,D-transpeptidase [Pseudohoeflea coraliihabitans]|uniref:L,D-transpeptidase n=1 Tax=Pseudohoeflea coraliihabitans TaxID=2860393 RepID=A0ABS6WPY2_9HYPH|nr:L,D-transpeptidase [Pseudohoeflea sp. DP4N28-3]MBW3098018.1 L,D-transpeptidase [Pseudohoeflea sp. DP4N28-3]
MKKIAIAAAIALLVTAPLGTSMAHAAPDGNQRSLLQILFPPSKNFGRTHRNSDKSPIPRRTIRFAEKHAKGTIIIDTSDRRLYHVLGNGKAMAYAIGVGREGFTWQGTNRITRKAEWPGWTPPQTMRDRVKRQEGRILPAYMKGGPDNPLGARALYIGSTIYRIHGTNQPWTIGKAMSSGCIRMANEDVINLYNQVGVGTRVIVRN